MIVSEGAFKPHHRHGVGSEREVRGIEITERERPKVNYATANVRKIEEIAGAARKVS